MRLKQNIQDSERLNLASPLVSYNINGICDRFYSSILLHANAKMGTNVLEQLGLFHLL